MHHEKQQIFKRKTFIDFHQGKLSWKYVLTFKEIKN